MKSIVLFKKAAIILSIVLLISILSGCSSNDNKIKNLLSEFENSCNTLDLDAMLNCINPSIANPIKTGISLVGLFTDVNTDEILQQIGKALTGNSGIGTNESFKSIQIEPIKIETSGDQATVTVKVSFKANGQTIDNNSSLKCIKVEGEWYIASFSLF